MSTIKYCDKCNKKQGKDRDGWSGFRILGGYGLKIKELGLIFTDFELCPDCAKVLLPKVINILKKK